MNKFIDILALCAITLLSLAVSDQLAENEDPKLLSLIKGFSAICFYSLYFKFLRYLERE